MKNLLLVSLLFAVCSAFSVSCRYAREEPLGDTVAASVFEPRESSPAQARADSSLMMHEKVKDSVGLYFVGDGSTRHTLQLVSYPSRRDTLLRGKTAHVRVKGSAAFGSVVRVAYYVLPGGDSLVSRVEQVVMGPENPSE